MNPKADSSAFRKLTQLPSRLAGFARNLGAMGRNLEGLRTFRKDIKTIESDLRKLKENMQELRHAQNLLLKWAGITNSKVNALMRAEFLDLAHNLNARGFQILSQHEEDGIVLALLKEIGRLDRRFVDIGCGAKGGNCGLLAAEFGWSGLMVDASAKAVRKLGEMLAYNQGVRVLQAFVTPENINDILRENGLDEPDVFSLDIDSYDYWVLEALRSRPKLLILEYNAQFGKEALTVPLGGIPEDAPKGFHGASLKALAQLAARKGYRLVCCENAGVNAFFLRDDLCPGIPGLDPDAAFRPQRARKDPLGGAEIHRNVLEVCKVQGLELIRV